MFSIAPMGMYAAQQNAFNQLCGNAGLAQLQSSAMSDLYRMNPGLSGLSAPYCAREKSTIQRMEDDLYRLLDGWDKD